MKYQNQLLKSTFLIIVTILLIIVAKNMGLTTIIYDNLQNILQWIESLGNVGYLVFILVYILATVFLIPGTILTLGAGAIFDVLKGSILVSVASTLGAVAAFLVGRYIARGWVKKQIEKQPKFLAIDNAVAQEGWKIVGLTRLSPIFPFVFLNYAFSITQVSLKDYLLASWIGMMPGTVMYVYIGSLIGDVALLATGNREKTALEWGLYLVGLLATIAVTVYVTRIAKNALNNELKTQENNSKTSIKNEG